MDDTLIPSQEKYREICTKLLEEKHMKVLIAVRMGCELGTSRLECVNARVSDLDRFHSRGLWIEIAKKIKHGKDDWRMRSREIPVNPSLYLLLKEYIEEEQVYILRRKFGDWATPFIPHYINDLYYRYGVPWNTHASRHFFKNAIVDWQRRNRQMDYTVTKSLMGHSLNGGHEQYGSISWNYKKEVIDNTFDDMLVYGTDKYEKTVANLSNTLGIPTDKIKFLYELFVHDSKFSHNGF